MRKGSVRIYLRPPVCADLTNRTPPRSHLSLRVLGSSNSYLKLLLSTRFGTPKPATASSPNSAVSLMTSRRCVRTPDLVNDLCPTIRLWLLITPSFSRRRIMSLLRYASPNALSVTPLHADSNDTHGSSHSQSTAPTRFSSQPIAASSSRSSLDARKP